MTAPLPTPDPMPPTVFELPPTDSRAMAVFPVLFGLLWLALPDPLWRLVCGWGLAAFAVIWLVSLVVKGNGRYVVETTPSGLVQVRRSQWAAHQTWPFHPQTVRELELREWLYKTEYLRIWRSELWVVRDDGSCALVLSDHTTRDAPVGAIGRALATRLGRPIHDRRDPMRRWRDEHTIWPQAGPPGEDPARSP